MLASSIVLLALHQALVVSPTGPWRTIGDAVREAPAGATITVRAGTYREPTIRITRPLSLIGEQGAVVDGEGGRELLVVAAPGVTIRGLAFRHTGASYREDRAAVRVVASRGCTISDNRFDDTFFGIYLQEAVGCVVERNRIAGEVGDEGGTGNGIHSWGSSYLTIRDNEIRGHRDGIYLEFSRHSTVSGNRSEGNRRYGLHFMYSDSSTYHRNTFGSNGTGVAVMYSREVTMSANRFTGNRGPSAYGLLLKEVVDARLDGNRFADNTTALVADGANRVRVTDNQFVRNGRAVRLLASTGDARFTGNSFEANTFDVVVNSRSTSAEFQGNWWDSYRGWDLDGDGTGDVAHHPVRLFALLVERTEAAMLLQRAMFVRLVDAAERTIPVLTPRNIRDPAPRMRPIRGGAT